MLALLALLQAHAYTQYFTSHPGGTLGVVPSVISGAVSSDEMSAALKPHLPALGACVDAPFTELTVVLTVSPAGAVTGATTYAEPAVPNVEACVGNAITAVTFPAGGPRRVQLILDPNAGERLNELLQPGTKGVQLGKPASTEAPATAPSTVDPKAQPGPAK